MEKYTSVAELWIRPHRVEPAAVKAARSANDAVNLITLLQQELSQVGPVLAGDPGNKRLFRHNIPRIFDDAPDSDKGLFAAPIGPALDLSFFVVNSFAMLRNVLAVVAGYFSMAAAVFLLLTSAYLAFGTERAFEPGSYKTSLAWCLTSLVLGIPAAVLGGWICARVALSPKAVTALLVVVAILGLLVAIPTFSTPAAPEARPANVPNLVAMNKAQTPPWVALLNIVVGVGGILIGSRRKNRP